MRIALVAAMVALPAPALPQVTFDGSPAALSVQVADDHAEIECGLMYRRSLPPDQGMLFVYASSGGFWMRDTLVPLSIAFLRADGTVLGTTEMRAAPRLDTTAYVVDGKVVDVPDGTAPPLGASLLAYQPPGPYSYVIEANRGWFARHGIRPGSRADLGAALRDASKAAPPRC